MKEGTKIEAALAGIRRVEDLDDLARVIMPGNRRHQHAFTVIFFVLKWNNGVVADLHKRALAHRVTKRVFERTRAKMHRLGLIEHVSRLSPKHGFRDGWKLSGKFEKGLEELASQIRAMKEHKQGTQREKDEFAINLLRPGEPCDTHPPEALHHGA